MCIRNPGSLWAANHALFRLRNIAQAFLFIKTEHVGAVIVRGMVEGWFTGQKLADFITLQHSDFVGARRIVNGTDRAVSIARFAREYCDELKRIGYGEARRAPQPATAPVERPAPPIAPARPPEAKPSIFAVLFSVIAKLFERKSA